MQYWIDHLAAVIIAGTVIFILAVMQLRGQEASIESVQFNTLRGSMRHLVDMIDQDFANIGGGMIFPNGTPTSSPAVVSLDTTSTKRIFRFYGLAEKPSPNPVDSSLIEYVWYQTGTVTLPGYDKTQPPKDVPTYVVKRVVDGDTTASSFDGITDFRITLRDGDVDSIVYNSGVIPPINPADYPTVRYVDVRMSMISPFGAGEVVEETRWFKRIRPLNLGTENRAYIVRDI